eukprot:gene1867-22543_t
MREAPLARRASVTPRGSRRLTGARTRVPGAEAPGSPAVRCAGARESSGVRASRCACRGARRGPRMQRGASYYLLPYYLWGGMGHGAASPPPPHPALRVAG